MKTHSKFLIFSFSFLLSFSVAIVAYSDDSLETEFKNFVLLFENEKATNADYKNAQLKLQEALKKNSQSIYADDAEYLLLSMSVGKDGAEQIKTIKNLIVRYPDFAFEPWTTEFGKFFLPRGVFKGIDQIKLELALEYTRINDYEKACPLLNELYSIYPQEKGLKMMTDGLKSQGRCP